MLSAFWMVQLDEESSKLTTFATPVGRFRWLGMPYEISVAPEIFQQKLVECLSDLYGVECIADDILIYGCGDTVDEVRRDHDVKLIALLDRCRQKQIRLNKDKLKLNQQALSYMGHVLSPSGLRPDTRKVDAIVNMPPPTDRQGVLRLLGMATYLARYVLDLAR
jgi:hypothetical protein